jgi:hypothetical protein
MNTEPSFYLFRFVFFGTNTHGQPRPTHAADAGAGQHGWPPGVGAHSKVSKHLFRPLGFEGLNRNLMRLTNENRHHHLSLKPRGSLFNPLCHVGKDETKKDLLFTTRRQNALQST